MADTVEVVLPEDCDANVAAAVIAVAFDSAILCSPPLLTVFVNATTKLNNFALFRVIRNRFNTTIHAVKIRRADKIVVCDLWLFALEHCDRSSILRFELGSPENLGFIVMSADPEYVLCVFGSATEIMEEKESKVPKFASVSAELMHNLKHKRPETLILGACLSIWCGLHEKTAAEQLRCKKIILTTCSKHHAGFLEHL